MARALKSLSQWNSNEICLPLEINLSVRIISYCWNVFINAIEWVREWLWVNNKESEKHKQEKGVTKIKDKRKSKEKTKYKNKREREREREREKQWGKL